MTGITFTFCQRHAGREIAERNGKIIGDITPDARGKGGWIYHFEKDVAQGRMPQPEFVRSRSEAHARIRMYEGIRQ